jgi:hypothetical protein
MREYAKRKAGALRSTTNERANRMHREWDVALHVTSKQSIAYILERVTKILSLFEYLLIGGEEKDSTLARDDTNSLIPHVHIAAIFKKEYSREEVLQLFTGIREGRSYCTPRNPSFCYLGWRVHHTKIDTKVTDKHCLLEWGELPKDDMTNEQKVKSLRRIIHKYWSKNSIPAIVRSGLYTREECEKINEKYWKKLDDLDKKNVTTGCKCSHNNACGHVVHIP